MKLELTVAFLDNHMSVSGMVTEGFSKEFIETVSTVLSQLNAKPKSSRHPNVYPEHSARHQSLPNRPPSGRLGIISAFP